MVRLFVAYFPASRMLDRLLGLKGGVRGARWLDQDQLHLTLRFIGEIDERRAEDVAAGLATLRFAAIPIALDDVGVFPPRGPTRQLWVGVAPRAPLAALHERIERICVRAGLEPEKRRYLPHITIARFGRKGGDCAPFLAAHAGLSGTPALLDRLALVESRLGHAGSSYRIVEEYPARAAAV